MLPGKVSFLFLLMCAIIYPHTVIGIPCTKEQKDEILNCCKSFIKIIGSSPSLPAQSGPCCEAVRKVKDMNMPCIVRLLKRKDRDVYSVERILHLEASLIEEKCLIEIASVFYEYASIIQISNRH
uniref:Bifunctional inhibitor/plant lipid transfer protein/seed storage helical domain-containing protein n=1 Tax=Leersia perrieri TaxID=77586 RepID=A0A0D9XQW9_9ORYZ